MSARFTSPYNCCRASRFFRFKATDLLPQLAQEKYAEISVPGSSEAVFQLRVTSPWVAVFSIFKTVAPSSAKNWPTLGPAKTLASSSTKRPAKGCSTSILKEKPIYLYWFCNLVYQKLLSQITAFPAAIGL